MEFASESELLSWFREVDRPEVEITQDLKFPLRFEGAQSWLESSGARAYLIYTDREGAAPKGIVFYRNTTPTPEAPAMCEWCHSVRGHGRVKLLAARSSAKKLVGLYLCHDLGCVHTLSDVPGPSDFRESLDPFDKQARIKKRIAQFANRSLF